MKRGVLLINVGTPDTPTAPDVKRYLREFLWDERVIDINPVSRWLLLNLIILPTRPKKSAEAYRKVWRDDGSPLLAFSREQQEGLAKLLADTPVELGMRYGNPSVQSALEKLRAQQVDHISVFPLYPQYASASTGSALAEVHRIVKNWPVVPTLDEVAPFYDAPEFIDSFVAVAEPLLTAFQPDHLLFSYHGLPVRQVMATDETEARCHRSVNCCGTIIAANHNCYRAQCFATSRALVEHLRPKASSTSFQSRLGRTPWIQPYTDFVLPELVQQGVKRLAVMCPSFVADCLETLEEVAIRAREQFLAAGGKEFLFVPSLNGHPTWLSGMRDLISL